ncbi:hypothetical protein BT63DRAFT_247118 [Microthyrium microscopicum]|uniref:Fungal N-terminal domain-containing protein n=1 Tax=Microthyrium microscopicum TaxID=703497 RepID=A0A6A6UCY2_9PEZI|nr:hypothetical protein BT63DRAFT_247118 [Microthyrium microscopicum]
MDPLSIIGTTASLVAIVAHVTDLVVKFGTHVRDARKEMNALSGELGSLKAALGMLEEDFKNPGITIPCTLQDILVECEAVIHTLVQALEKYNQERLLARAKYAWSGKETMAAYRSTLSAHNAALVLAIDVMTFSLTREIKAGVEQTRDSAIGIKADTEEILDQIAKLQAQLPGYGIGEASVTLQNYLDEVTEYATVADEFEPYEASDTSSQHCNIEDHNATTSNPIITPAIEITEEIQPISPEFEKPLELASRSNSQATSISNYLSWPYKQSVDIGDGHDGFSWEIGFGIPEHYATIGLETQRHRRFRESVEEVMKTISNSEFGPKNGRTYESGKDFHLEHYGSNDENIGVIPILRCPPVRDSIKEKSTLALWIAQFTGSGICSNHQINLSSGTTGSKRSSRWSSPLMIALEMQNWQWVRELIIAGAIPTNSKEESSLQDSKEPRNCLQAAADWNLAMLKFCLTQFEKVDMEATAALRYDTLISLIQDWKYFPHTYLPRGQDTIARAEPDTLRLYVAELLLLAGSPLSQSRLEDVLFKSVAAENVLMVQLLLEKAQANPNIPSTSLGSPLHLAIERRNWAIAKLLVGNKANCLQRCYSTYDDRSHFLNAIEWAAHQGTLGKLNKTLGTQYKDPRTIKQRIRSGFV